MIATGPDSSSQLCRQLQCRLEADVSSRGSIVHTLTLVADAARDAQCRAAFQQCRLLSKIVPCFHRNSISNDEIRQLLRCIANICYESDDDRNTVLEGGLVHQMCNCLENTALRQTAVGALFNLCNDYEPAIKAAASAGLQGVLLRILDVPHAHFEDFVFHHATILINWLAPHLAALKLPADAREIELPKLLHLAAERDIETDEFVKLTETLFVLMQQEGVQNYLIKGDLFTPFQSLMENIARHQKLKAEEIRSITENANPHQEDLELALQSLKELDALQDKVLNLWATFSTAPAFQDVWLTDQDFAYLVDRYIVPWIGSETVLFQISGIILLGNLAMSNSVCELLVSRWDIHIPILGVARGDAEPRTVHAAAGLLKNLSIPVSNTDKLLNEGLEAVIHKLLSVSQRAETQQVAVDIVRLILANHPSWWGEAAGIQSRRTTSVSSVAKESSILTKLKTLSEQNNQPGMRIKVGRALIALLRALHRSNINDFTGLSPDDRISKQSNAIRIYQDQVLLDVLISMIQPSNPDFIRFEGSFGLGLVASSKEGAEALLQAFRDDEKLILLRSGIEYAAGTKVSMAIATSAKEELHIPDVYLPSSAVHEQDRTSFLTPHYRAGTQKPSQEGQAAEITDNGVPEGRAGIKAVTCQRPVEGTESTARQTTDNSPAPGEPPPEAPSADVRLTSTSSNGLKSDFDWKLLARQNLLVVVNNLSNASKANRDAEECEKWRTLMAYSFNITVDSNQQYEGSS